MSRDQSSKGPAVENGELLYTSPSAMQKADVCLRFWRYRYVERLPDKPPGKGAIRGTEGHERIEKYLKTGVLILDPLELKGLPFMPPPSAGYPVLVEQPIEGVVTADGVKMIGFIDLAEIRKPGDVVLTDWKFKSDPKKWGAKAEDLVNPNHEAAIQMLPYAVWAANQAERFGLDDSKTITLRHVIFQTKGAARATEVVAGLTLTRAKQLWETVSRRIVPKMRQAAKAAKASDVPYDTTERACEKYGGCAYKDVCPRVRGRSVINFNKGAPMPFLSGVLNNTMIPKESPFQPPPPAQPPPAKKFEVKDVIQAKDANVGSEYMVETPMGGAAPCTFVGTNDLAGETYAYFRQTGKPPFMVALDKEITVVAPPPPKAPEPAPAPPPPAPAAEAAAPAPEKPKRGRPRKDATPPPAPAAEPDQSEGVPSYEGIYLYFGCSPLGVQLQSLNGFAELVEKATLDAREYSQLEDRPIDIRASQDSVFGFGKWKGYLAAMARETILAPGHYLVTQGDERVEVAAQALIAKLPPGHVFIGGGR